jgi:hypothetical protein
MKQRPDYSTSAGRGDHMKKRLKVRITTVREQTIKMPEAVVNARCQTCDREVEMLTQAHAGAILQVSTEALDQLIAIGRVHTLETISGRLLICKESLLLR